MVGQCKLQHWNDAESTDHDLQNEGIEMLAADSYSGAAWSLQPVSRSLLVAAE